MATGVNGIGTISEFAEKFNVSGYSGSRCPTKSELDQIASSNNLTLSYSKSFSDDQCVVYTAVTSTPSGSGTVTLSFVNNGYALYYSTSGSGTGTQLGTGQPGSISISNLSAIYLKGTSSNTYLYLSQSGNDLSVVEFDHRQFIGTSWTKLTYTGWTNGYSYNFTAFNQ